jgi:hypothetical protein
MTNKLKSYFVKKEAEDTYIIYPTTILIGINSSEEDVMGTVCGYINGYNNNISGSVYWPYNSVAPPYPANNGVYLNTSTATTTTYPYSQIIIVSCVGTTYNPTIITVYIASGGAGGGGSVPIDYADAGSSGGGGAGDYFYCYTISVTYTGPISIGIGLYNNQSVGNNYNTNLDQNIGTAGSASFLNIGVGDVSSVGPTYCNFIPLVNLNTFNIPNSSYSNLSNLGGKTGNGLSGKGGYQNWNDNGEGIDKTNFDIESNEYYSISANYLNYYGTDSPSGGEGGSGTNIYSGCGPMSFNCSPFFEYLPVSPSGGGGGTSNGGGNGGNNSTSTSGNGSGSNINGYNSTSVGGGGGGAGSYYENNPSGGGYGGYPWPGFSLTYIKSQN